MEVRLPNYLDVVDAATRVRGKVRCTPIFQSEGLDALTDARLIVKAESLQETGSFKLRGATNRLLKIPEAKRKAGVVAFSSGNHAQGVALAAKRLNMPAVIVMPKDAPEVKTAGVLAAGAEIYAYNRLSESREEIAASIAAERGATLVPSFDDPDIIAGQGTAGLEFIEQLAADQQSLDYLICCTGGGGLITGMALAFQEHSPQTKILTAEPEGHDDWRQSLQCGTIQSNPPGTRSVCDAILTPAPGALTWALGRRLLSGGCVVSDAQVYSAMRAAFKYLKLVVEPGGAAALAAALYNLPPEAKGKTIGVMLTGGNVDPALFAKVLSG